MGEIARTRLVGMQGRRFGALVVEERAPQGKNGKVYWLCTCDCGSKKSICGSSLRNGSSSSCGCGIAASNRNRSVHGLTHTPEHKVWRQIIQRCENPRGSGYANYGGRGIRICQEWREDFRAFLADMGPRPSGKHSIERADTNGDYCPSNCFWATRSQQNENTRVSRTWVINGVEYPSSTAAGRAFGLTSSAIIRRCNGYSYCGRFYPPRPGHSSFLKYEVAR